MKGRLEVSKVIILQKWLKLPTLLPRSPPRRPQQCSPQRGFACSLAPAQSRPFLKLQLRSLAPTPDPGLRKSFPLLGSATSPAHPQRTPLSAPPCSYIQTLTPQLHWWSPRRMRVDALLSPSVPVHKALDTERRTPLHPLPPTPRQQAELHGWSSQDSGKDPRNGPVARGQPESGTEKFFKIVVSNQFQWNIIPISVGI